MKKLFVSLTMLFCFVTYMSATEPIFPSGDYVLIDMRVSYIDPTKPIGERPRTPIQPPTVYLCDHTLYICGDYGNFSLLVQTDNGTTAYSTYVPSGTTEVQLPSTLSGDYLLQLECGNFLFTGEINL